MEFYSSTEAKQYARNKTRIIKEINDIEETIAEAIDNNEFSCDVYDTVMTDTREFVEPEKNAQAHCIMELNTVKIHKDYDDTIDDDTFIKNIDGEYAIQSEPIDNVMCGYAPDFKAESYADGGDANSTIQKKDYFRVGEVLVVRDRNDINPLEFKVKEINDNGEIIDLEIVSRGEFDKEIFSSAKLVYKEMDKWLDLYSDYGIISDLRIDRDGNVTVKDLTDIYCDEIAVKSWQPIGKTYKLGILPPDYFGNFGDIYIENGDTIYIKTNDGWVVRNKIYNYKTFKLPFNYGIEGTICYNVFGKNWVKTKCGWEIVNNVYNLGDSYRPCLYNYKEGDVVIYNQVIRDEHCEIVKKIKHVLYKCCSNHWREMVEEYDWSFLPAENFGSDLDLFIYPDGSYKVKINGKWYAVDEEHRFDSMYYDDNFGDEHDVIIYSGEYEAYSTYVKLKASDNYPKGHWVRVDKVWNLNDYLLGKIPVDVDLTWTIKNIILDKKGDGYIYKPTVVFSNGNAVADVKVVNDKIVEIILIKGGDDYTDTIPEINFTMIAPALSKKYFQVWKRLLENNVLQDEMNQVIDYFENTKKYTISRVTSDSGETFHWHLSWN